MYKLIKDNIERHVETNFQKEALIAEGFMQIEESVEQEEINIEKVKRTSKNVSKEGV